MFSIRCHGVESIESFHGRPAFYWSPPFRIGIRHETATKNAKKKTPTNQQTKNLISLSLSLFLSFYFFISSSLDRKRSVGLKLKKKINRSFRSDFCCLFLERHATFRYWISFFYFYIYIISYFFHIFLASMAIKLVIFDFRWFFFPISLNYRSTANRSRVCSTPRWFPTAQKIEVFFFSFFFFFFAFRFHFFFKIFLSPTFVSTAPNRWIDFRRRRRCCCCCCCWCCCCCCCCCLLRV